jgi:uncharacterized membrane protein YecN with MAPEG domain
MSIQITALYAAIFALWLTALAINVTVHRVKLRVPVGDGNNAQMRRMIRLHGNAAEYVPIALLLMLFYEVNGGSHTVLHVVALLFLFARLMHAWGLGVSDMTNQRRQIGQGLTWLIIVALAVLNLWKLV